MKLSIIIASLLDETESLMLTLCSIAEIKDSNLEVLICVQTSDLNSSKLVSHRKTVENYCKRQNLAITIFYDFKKGSSANRNQGLRAATGDIAVIVDGDTTLTKNAFDIIRAAYNKHKGYTAIAFMTQTQQGLERKKYPRAACGISPIGVFSISCIEITFDLRLTNRLSPPLAFNEDFGVGCHFCLGEECILLRDIQRGGGNILFYPGVINVHDLHSTGTQLNEDKIRSLGATMRACFGRLSFLVVIAFWIKKAKLLAHNPGLYISFKALISGAISYSTRQEMKQIHIT